MILDGSDARPSLAQQIESNVRQFTHGRIRNLVVKEERGQVIVSGQVPSRHAKQLAMHGALELISGDCFCYNIRVGGAAGGRRRPPSSSSPLLGHKSGGRPFPFHSPLPSERSRPLRVELEGGPFFVHSGAIRRAAGRPAPAIPTMTDQEGVCR